MAQEEGAIATETPATQPAIDAASLSLIASGATKIDSSRRANSLKRSLGETADPAELPAAKSARTDQGPATAPAVTATARSSAQSGGGHQQDDADQELVGEPQKANGTTAPNPTNGSSNMSRPSDVPTAPTANMEPVGKPGGVTVVVPETEASEPNPAATSPQSTGSGMGLGVNVTESPTPMDVDSQKPDESIQPSAQEDKPQPSTSLSYPGTLNAGGSSMPAPAPPNREKPYACQVCDMRFRRLHDLKRHGKLHTGEKPHVCPKCDRKFARGDALARHSKGAGGCAGRRSSMGSFAEDSSTLSEGTRHNTSMTGVIYDEPMAMEEGRQNLPSIRLNDGRPGPSRSGSGPQRAATTGGLFPPSSASTATSSGGGHTPNTSVSSMPMSARSDTMYSQGMTESPKPLSPAIPNAPDSLGRQRSPSMTFGQQPIRRASGRRTPPNIAIQSGPGAKLPGLTNIAPHDARYQKSSGPENNAIANELQGVWNYIQTLEDRLVQMEKADKDKQALINTLVTDIGRLRQQRDAEAAAAASAYGTTASPEVATAPAPAASK